MADKKCRICLKPDNLIKACNCRKVFAHVHSTCLKECLELMAHRFCDICGFQYIIEKEHKTVWTWFSDNSEEFENLMEIIVKTVNIVQILFLTLIVCSFVGLYNIWTYILAAIMFIRVLNIIYMWCRFIGKVLTEYSQWKKSNFTIQVFPNPIRDRPKV